MATRSAALNPLPLAGRGWAGLVVYTSGYGSGSGYVHVWSTQRARSVLPLVHLSSSCSPPGDYLQTLLGAAFLLAIDGRLLVLFSDHTGLDHLAQGAHVDEAADLRPLRDDASERAPLVVGAQLQQLVKWIHFGRQRAPKLVRDVVDGALLVGGLGAQQPIEGLPIGRQ